jgi:hypothetical protein
MPQSEVIKTTAANASAELVRRGIGPDEPVTITIDLEAKLIPGRRESRARIVAAGLTDDDIDRMIDEARNEVQPLLK